MKKLDFLVIGAQKAGTTALHMYLKDNPEIYMPPEKEAIFFTDDLRYAKGEEWYFKEFFAGGQSDQLWGKATPAYSCYPSLACSRIKNHNRKIKIIYIVRDPIARAISQYKMNKKRGLEERSFSALIRELLTGDFLITDDNTITEVNSYFLWGKYLSVLDKYSWVEKNNIMVLSDNYLKSRTSQAVIDISKFLDVEFIDTESIAKKFHVGGVRRFKIVDRIRSIDYLKNIWRNSISFKYRRRISFWLDQWNTKESTAENIALSDEELSILKEYYSDEFEFISKLEKMNGVWIK